MSNDRVFFRTWSTSWKAKRLRWNADVEVAPSTFLGKRRGPVIRATAHLLSGGDAELARRALAHRQPILHGLVVPLIHKLARYQTVHYELTPRV